jgi:hypothetical protein
VKSCHAFAYLLKLCGEEDGIFTPADRALLRRIAVRCFLARSTPNLRRVLFRTAGGFDFISSPMLLIVLWPAGELGEVPMESAFEMFLGIAGECRFFPELAASVLLLGSERSNRLASSLGLLREQAASSVLFHLLARFTQSTHAQVS